MERVLQIEGKQAQAEFLRFLDAVSKINDSAIFDIDNTGISCIVASTDNTLMLYAKLKLNTNCIASINIPDIKKLYRVLDTISDDTIKLKVNSNNIEYKGKDLKFKYHLFEDGFLMKPNFDLDKFKTTFKPEVDFEFTRENLQQLFKGSTFASETNKLYMYTEDNAVKFELTDRVRHNTDNFTITVAEADFDMEPVPVNLDNVRLLTHVNDTFVVSANPELGVVVVDNFSDNTKLKYIIASLTQ